MTEQEAPEQGFTLFELLLVLSIIAAAMALVLPSLSAGLSSLRTKSTALEVSAELARARERSVRERRAYYVEAAQGALLVKTSHGKEISLPVKDGMRVEVASAITFYPDGLSSGGQITLRAADDGFRINVLPNGRTLLEKFNE